MENLQKEDCEKIKHYRHVSILYGFSKIYERLLHGSLTKFMEKIFSHFMAL